MSLRSPAPVAARLICCAVLFLAFSLGASAQETRRAEIKGTVVDSAGFPLPGVNVVVEGLRVGSATDVSGQFRIRRVPAGSHVLLFSAVGFETRRETITLSDDSVATVDVILTETSFLANEIVVTASRRAQLSSTVPASFSIIQPRKIERLGANSLDQTLRYVPGVQVMENQVNIRGSSGYSYNVGSRVLLLVDGVPMLTPDSDGVPFDALPFSQIEQIEIVKGPGSSLWGSGALGGVINVITAEYPDEPETMARVQTGIHEPVSREDWLEKWPDGRDPQPFWAVTASHARRVGKSLGLWLHVDHRDDRGYANMKTERFTQVYGKLGWQPGSTTDVDLLLSGLTRRKENFLFWNGLEDALNPGQPTVGGSDARAVTDVQTDQLTVAPSIRQIINEQLLLHARFRAFGTRIEGVNDDETGSGNVTHGFRYGGELQLNWSPGSTRNLVAGVSRDQNSTESPFFVTSEGDVIGNQPELAVFGQYEETIARRLTVVAGLRYTAYAVTTVETIDKASPKLAISYQAGPSLTFRLAYGQGLRVPSLPERFIDDQGFIPLYPNFELLPEESTGYELGGRWDARLGNGMSFRLDIAGFWNEYDGLIEPKLQRISAPGEEIEVGFRFVNLRQARIVGVETSVDIGFAGGLGSGYAGYTFMDTEDLEEEEPLPFRPRHLFTTGFALNPARHLEVGADFRMSSSPERLDSDFAIFVPDADVWIPSRTLDGWIAYRFGIVRLAIHARNATDRYYTERPAFLAAPRHYFAELRVDF